KASGNFQTIQKYIKLLEIDVSHFDSIKAATRGLNQYSKSIKYTDEQLFQKNSLIPKNSVRRRYKELVEYKCVICKLENSWQDKKLILQMDHINGDRTDHRLENLRWLCPNCHSQTETYGFKLNRPVKKIHKCLNCNKKIHPSSIRCLSCNGLKTRKIQRPNKETLKELIDNNTWVSIGKMYGITDNGIKRWAREYQLI